jgi:hypothetical protein
MADYTTNLDSVSESQALKATKVNELIDAASPATLYGRHASSCSGNTWGYYGGPMTKADASIAVIANGTLTLALSSSNYIVAQKSNGAVSSSTTTTNWNDTANYWRLYSVVCGATTATDWDDYRQIGAMTGHGTGPVAPVTKTGNFTLGSNELQIICNGTASITVTLPAASGTPGRAVRIKTIAAYTVISASSNVVPLAGGAAGTAILAATAGKWAELVSDGTNWIIMAAA